MKFILFNTGKYVIQIKGFIKRNNNIKKTMKLYYAVHIKKIKLNLTYK